MKTILNFLYFFISPLILFIVLVLPSTITAQDIHYRDPYNPAKGYWKLYTDAATRTTSVKFFDVNHSLFYEEVIPGKYIKLTNRNINRINEAFDQVNGNRFVQTKVKSNALPFIPIRHFGQKANTTHSNPEKANPHTLIDSGILINGFKYANSPKYCLMYKNPARKSVHVYLKDEEEKVLFSEYTSKADYSRKFNFKGLHPGRYTLIVATTKPKYKYTEKLTISPSTQTLQVAPGNSNFQASSASNF